jgi:hypothetical protein
MYTLVIRLDLNTNDSRVWVLSSQSTKGREGWAYLLVLVTDKGPDVDLSTLRAAAAPSPFQCSVLGAANDGRRSGMSEAVAQVGDGLAVVARPCGGSAAERNGAWQRR